MNSTYIYNRLFSDSITLTSSHNIKFYTIKYLVHMGTNVCKCTGTYTLLYNTHPVVAITTPPGNTTVCRGSGVTINCGHLTATASPITWIINGTSFDQQEIVDSPLYQLNFATSPMFASLTVFSINGTTTFQCIVLSTPNTTSTRGTVTVISGTYTYICTYSYTI